jgi:hypothetical protein
VDGEGARENRCSLSTDLRRSLRCSTWAARRRSVLDDEKREFVKPYIKISNLSPVPPACRMFGALQTRRRALRS